MVIPRETRSAPSWWILRISKSWDNLQDPFDQFQYLKDFSTGGPVCKNGLIAID
jgi:hypothetical protein